MDPELIELLRDVQAGLDAGMSVAEIDGLLAERNDERFNSIATLGDHASSQGITVDASGQFVFQQDQEPERERTSIGDAFLSGAANTLTGGLLPELTATVASTPGLRHIVRAPPGLSFEDALAFTQGREQDVRGDRPISRLVGQAAPLVPLGLALGAQSGANATIAEGARRAGPVIGKVLKGEGKRRVRDLVGGAAGFEIIRRLLGG